jgi:hypothetical protein
MAGMRSVALDHVNSDVTLPATICCASPKLLQRHHVDYSRGLSACFEGGNILPSPEAGNLSGSYVEDPGLLVRLVFLVTKRDGTLLLSGIETRKITADYISAYSVYGS